MNNLCLVDTSVWIYALRKAFVPEIKSYVERMIDDDRIVIVPIIKLELLSGTRTKKEFSRLKLRLDALPEVAFTERLWDTAQELAFRLRRKGLAIPLIDILIIAGAISADAVLVHQDRHFDLAAEHVAFKAEHLSAKFT
jgi:predicted nucleic acid-binding protein